MRMITCGGETLSVRTWARRLGVAAPVIYKRLALGWPEDEAVTTPKEEPKGRLRLITHAGETLSVSQWARRIGVRPYVLHLRLRRGWPLAVALTQPHRERRIAVRTITHDGETLTVAQWARRLDAGTDLLYGRLRLGWPEADVVTRPKGAGTFAPCGRRGTPALSGNADSIGAGD